MLKKIKLSGEQRKVLTLPIRNPVQIKGVAGSGKSTVALYRARHLHDTNRNLFSLPTVGIITFSKPLANYLRSLLPYVGDADGANVGDGLPVSCQTAHSFAWKVAADGDPSFRQKKTVSGWKRDKFVEMALGEVMTHSNDSILSQPVSFFADEISWIKGRGIRDFNRYNDTPRTGRGTAVRVLEGNRKTLWSVFEKYTDCLSAANSIDFDDYAGIAEQIASRSDYQPPFTHLVIDEAQDLTQIQLSLLSKSVSKETKSLTLIADAAQRIYRNGFSWRDVGINVSGGRSVELSVDYRNPKGIALAATKVLKNEKDRTDFTTLRGAKPGDGKPAVKMSHSNNEAFEWLRQELDQIDLDSDSVVLLHRRNGALDLICDMLKEFGIPHQHFRRVNNSFPSTGIMVCTMSSVKGMEFDHVFIMGASKSMIPMSTGVDLDEEAISAERRLFYTAMTRAEKTLQIHYQGEPTMFLEEMLA